ncbi:hypothetical protein MASR2M8_16270 [Opitutaceae bacterium]
MRLLNLDTMKASPDFSLLNGDSQILAAALIAATPGWASEGTTTAKGAVALPTEIQARPVKQTILTSPPHYRA